MGDEPQTDIGQLQREMDDYFREQGTVTDDAPPGRVFGLRCWWAGVWGRPEPVDLAEVARRGPPGPAAIPRSWREPLDRS